VKTYLAFESISKPESCLKALITLRELRILHELQHSIIKQYSRPTIPLRAPRVPTFGLAH
jgi:hypothetical protein